MIKTAYVNSFEMDYTVFGHGERNLVIIPGLSLKSIMLSAKGVAAAYARFTDEFTVYLFDVRKDIPDDYTLVQFADDTAAVMESIGISNSDILGVSMGGMISQLLAVRHPALVSRLVLVSTQARKNSRTPDTVTRWNRLAAEGRTSELVPDMLDNVYSEVLLKNFRNALLKANADISTEELRRCTVLTAAIARFDILAELEKIKCPVLVIGSEDDRVFGPDSSRCIAEAVKGELYIYPSPYGHAVYDEAPDFLDRVSCFLSQKEI